MENIIQLKQAALEALYDEALGYGRVTWPIKEKYDYLQINELSNAFVSNTQELPFYYRIQVPSLGNYKVCIQLEGTTDESNITLFLQRRRCAVKNEKLKRNTPVELDFVVNVGDIIPEGKSHAYEDRGIDVSIIGASFNVLKIEIEPIQVPTLYLIGDSTCTDQSALYPYDPFTSYCGWGQMLPLFLNQGVAVANHAHSGKSTESFKKEGHWEIIKNVLKQEDWVFIQFGHNDQKLVQLGATEGYTQYLETYIDEVLELGAYPVIVTPVSRNLWNGPQNTFNDLLIAYAQACKAVGNRKKVPVVDLHQKSVAFIQKEGPIEAMKYFYPKDWTHYNDFGAEIIARFVIEEIQLLQLSLSKFTKARHVEEVESKALANWQRPTWEAFQSLISDWELSNEWVKPLLDNINE